MRIFCIFIFAHINGVQLVDAARNARVDGIVDLLDEGADVEFNGEVRCIHSTLFPNLFVCLGAVYQVPNMVSVEMIGRVAFPLLQLHKILLRFKFAIL